MVSDENTENNKSKKKTTEFETKKIKLSEKSEDLFNKIDTVEIKIEALKDRLANDKNNKMLFNELKTLEQEKEELKEFFNNNNNEIQEINEKISEKNSVDKKQVKDNNGQDHPFQRLYDSEDELPVVKVLAEDFRKKAEEKISSKIHSIQEITQNLVDEFNSLDPKILDELEMASNIDSKKNTADIAGANAVSSVSTTQLKVSDVNDVDASNDSVTEGSEVKTDAAESKKSTEKLTIDKNTTKSIADGINSVSISDTDFKTEAVIEPKEFVDIKPLSLDDMLHLMKRFSEKIITLAKTSVDKNVKVSTSLFNDLQANIQTVDNYIQEIAKRMNMFQVHLNKLTESFNKRFLNDKAKDQAFDKLYESMQEYKDDFLVNAKKPIFLDLIRLNDDIQKMLSQENNGSSEEETDNKLELISDLVIEILYRNDIDVISEAPKIFDRNFQKSVKRVITDSKEKDREVVEILKIGFIHGSQIVRPQEVSVYIYEGKD
ncbi:MAG: nucleotide exchange factor GrpE [Planctomycetes bacterium]|nr:nucleotide exchange factor GrpE [Planctomycetota bacterium]